MHNSFDYAQQVHFPLQVGPLFFFKHQGNASVLVCVQRVLVIFYEGTAPVSQDFSLVNHSTVLVIGKQISSQIFYLIDEA
ncbi:hypothetical protein KUTeg_008217 [Tegillarca granosa]|uniref:Uncharacterized protein n=1 Tax=Tegillarca granosa TaxID=220873 RepID=A0ABQ9F8I8_TEGGR|nr:hypothetical protein KUTeg_008217 [Tegillarca granosa]